MWIKLLAIKKKYIFVLIVGRGGVVVVMGEKSEGCEPLSTYWYTKNCVTAAVCVFGGECCLDVYAVSAILKPYND